VDRRTAKEFLHIRDWLDRAARIVDGGLEAYQLDPLLREAGDSLLMKIGEAATRLGRTGVEPPGAVRWSDAIGNRNWLIHQYDLIDRDITWSTLCHDLPSWRAALAEVFTQAERIVSSSPEETAEPPSEHKEEASDRRVWRTVSPVRGRWEPSLR